MLEGTLLEAIGLIRRGNKEDARLLLEEVLTADRTNETAWLWLADCAETREESIRTLENCLRALPNASRAKAALELLRAETPGKQRSIPLADRLVSSDKNLKSQPVPRLPTGKTAHSISKPEMDELRQSVPEQWVPVVANDAHAAEPERPAPPSEVEDLILDETELNAPPEPPEAQSGQGAEPWIAPLPEPVDAFTISPDLFTVDEINALQENLGTLPAAPRRVRLRHNRGEDWHNLSEAEVKPRKVTRRAQAEREPPNPVLVYGLLFAGSVVLLIVLLTILTYLVKIF